jgi:hypothetical protein
MTNQRGHDDQQKLLIEIIKRFDAYINSSNSKIAIILSYCMAYIGGLGFKLVDLSQKQQPHNIKWWLVLVVALASILVTLWAARFAYLALNPQVQAGRALHETPSVVFFGDVTSHPGGRNGYAETISKLTTEQVVEDLAFQAYALAGITNSKFVFLGKATKSLVHLQLPTFALTLILLITAL